MSRRKPEGGADIAEMNKAQAAVKRAQAARAEDSREAAWLEEEAATLGASAADLLGPAMHATQTLQPGLGGEFLVNCEGALTDRPGLRDTVYQRGDMLAAEASLQRLELVGEVNALTLAVDTAETIDARNGVERMLAHQMATAHSMALRLAAKADHFASLCQSWDNTGRQQVQSIEAARMANASARMMDAFGRAALTLQRLRNGGRQTVVVQHVAVAGGGQAVVAGTVTPGEKPK